MPVKGDGLATGLRCGGPPARKAIFPSPDAFLRGFPRGASGPRGRDKLSVSGSGCRHSTYVPLHMLGNLKLYQAAEALNHYAEWLREIGSPAMPHGSLLWIVRIVLLVSVGLHLLAAAQLTWQNRRARRGGYRNFVYQRSSYAARTMRWGGIVILLFVIYHLLHFTWGMAHRDFVSGDVPSNPERPYQHARRRDRHQVEENPPTADLQGADPQSRARPYAFRESRVAVPKRDSPLRASGGVRRGAARRTFDTLR